MSVALPSALPCTFKHASIGGYQYQCNVSASYADCMPTVVVGLGPAMTTVVVGLAPTMPTAKLCR
jgi:hypothetical protein